MERKSDNILSRVTTMNLNKEYKIGLRAIKTSVAVAICALISMFLNHEDIFCACIASVICMEQTYAQTKDTGLNRIIGTMAGGIIGYLGLECACALPYYEWVRIIFLPICILCVVYICNFVNKKNAVSIGCVVVIVILSRSGSSKNSTWLYVIQRVTDTLIGIFVAMVVNRYMFTKKKSDANQHQ